MIPFPTFSGLLMHILSALTQVACTDRALSIYRSVLPGPTPLMIDGFCRQARSRIQPISIVEEDRYIPSIKDPFPGYTSFSLDNVDTGLSSAPVSTNNSLNVVFMVSETTTGTVNSSLDNVISVGDIPVATETSLSVIPEVTKSVDKPPTVDAKGVWYGSTPIGCPADFYFEPVSMTLDSSISDAPFISDTNTSALTVSFVPNATSVQNALILDAHSILDTSSQNASFTTDVTFLVNASSTLDAPSTPTAPSSSLSGASSASNAVYVDARTHESFNIELEITYVLIFLLFFSWFFILVTSKNPLFWPMVVNAVTISYITVVLEYYRIGMVLEVIYIGILVYQAAASAQILLRNSIRLLVHIVYWFVDFSWALIGRLHRRHFMQAFAIAVRVWRHPVNVDSG